MEKTLILVKPDAFARGLSGEIIARFERKGLKIIAAKHMTVSEDLAKQHYAEHTERPFFGELVSFITSGPIIALVFEGEDAIKAARQVIGATNPLEATTGSIRGDFAIAVGTNMVHGSDSPESGIREAGAVLPELVQGTSPPPHPDHPTCDGHPRPASASPQRRAILTQVGIPFDVRVSGVEEETHGDPSAVAEENARRKAAAIDYAHYKEGVPATTLGADTLVAVDGDILGKPRRRRPGARIRRAPGRSHAPGGRRRSRSSATARPPKIAVEITQVHFRPASAALLDWYVETGEWQGRAGGYAIQGAGAVLVAGIEGDYLNVVGLPLAAPAGPRARICCRLGDADRPH